MLIKKLLDHKAILSNDKNVIINWDPLKRCMLMLALCCGLNVLWIMWKLYVLLTPSVQAYINMPIMYRQLILDSSFLFIFAGLIYFCHRYRDSTTAQGFLPYVCVAVFSINLSLNGYAIGFHSPATALVVVSVTAVGLLLFERKIVYTSLFPSLLLLLILMYLTYHGYLPHAPIFDYHVMNYKPFSNGFWIMSMFAFMLPVVVVCFALFEIMLQQWRVREHSFKILSQVDPLTNTLNRRSINEQLLKIESNLKETKRLVGIILLDLDFFKNINDSFGHIKGDEVLVKVAETLKNNIRFCDTIGRYGGEEFIIIVENTTPTLSYQIAQRCRQALADLQIQSNEANIIKVTASFGIAFISEKITVQQALHSADIAMYQAKEAGRNHIIVAV